MADDNIDVVDEAQAEKDFTAGFENPTAQTPPAPDPKEEKAEPEKEAAAPEGDDAPKDPPDPVDPPPPPEPEYVKITKEQYAKLEGAATEVETLKSKLDKAFGSIGGVQQLVKELQAKTPEGAAVEIPAEAFQEMEEEFPDIAKHMRGVLEKTLKNVRGTGETKTVVDTEAMSKLVADGIKQREMETLEDDHPDWRVIVGAVDSADKADPNNPFRKWLKTQPVSYQEKINSTHSAAVLSRAIDKFVEASKVPPPPPPPPKDPAPKKEARRSRIEDAVQPKGDNNPPPPTKTDDDAFNEGFRSG